MQNALKFDHIRKELPGVFMTLGLVAILTALLFALVWEVGLAHGSVVFLIPVVIAATRWGVVSAVVAAICGVLASAFFFYPPLYSFRIKDPQEVIDLILFIFVAVAVSQLATRLKWQLEMARQREIDLRDLYAFSRRLAVAFDVSDIHAAIEDHLASIMQRNVVLFPSAREASNSSGRRAGITVPERVLTEVVEVASGHRDTTAGAMVTAESGEVWLVRAVSPKAPEFGVIAINLGRELKERSDELRIRVDAVLADATATLERLGVAHAINEARMRAQTDQLREALIGSVSHELRTPLASILGAATVLGAAPALEMKRNSRHSCMTCAMRPSVSITISRISSTRPASAATASSRTRNGQTPPTSSTRPRNAADIVSWIGVSQLIFRRTCRSFMSIRCWSSRP